MSNLDPLKLTTPRLPHSLECENPKSVKSDISSKPIEMNAMTAATVAPDQYAFNLAPAIIAEAASMTAKIITIAESVSVADSTATHKELETQKKLVTTLLLDAKRHRTKESELQLKIAQLQHELDYTKNHIELLKGQIKTSEEKLYQEQEDYVYYQMQLEDNTKESILLVNENKELKAAAVAAKKSKEKMAQKNKRRLEKLEAMVGRLENSIKNLEAHPEKVISVQKSVETLTLEPVNLEKETIREKIQKLEEELKKAQAETREKSEKDKNTIATLTKKLELQQKVIDEQEESIRKNKHQLLTIEQLEHDHKALQGKYKEAQSVISEFDAIRELYQGLKEKLKNTDDLQKRNEQLEKDLREKDEKLKKQEQFQNQLTSELEKRGLLQNPKENELRKVREIELQREWDKVKRLEHRYIEFQKTQDRYRSRFIGLHQENALLKRELKTRKKDYSQALTEVSRAQNLTKKHEEHIQRLNNELDDLKKKYQAEKEDLNNKMKQSNDSMNQQSATLQQQSSIIEQQGNTIRQLLNTNSTLMQRIPTLMPASFPSEMFSTTAAFQTTPLPTSQSTFIPLPYQAVSVNTALTQTTQPQQLFFQYGAAPSQAPIIEPSSLPIVTDPDSKTPEIQQSHLG